MQLLVYRKFHASVCCATKRHHLDATRTATEIFQRMRNRPTERLCPATSQSMCVTQAAKSLCPQLT